MKKITLEDTARELGLSRSTIMRVLRNDPCVREETRRRVTEYLTRAGFYNRSHYSREKILLDCRQDTPSIRNMIRDLEETPFFRNITFVWADCMNNRAAFLREVQDSAALVFFGATPRKYFLMAREANPDLFIIHALSGGMRCANVAIEPDDASSGRLAAEYLYEMGHRDIMAVCIRSNASCMTRAKSFVSEFTFQFPNGSVDPLLINEPDPQWEEKFLAAMKRRKTFPTAIACFGCTLQEGILQSLGKLRLSIPEDISILSHDNPEDFLCPVSRPCDSLVFDLSEITRLVGYFIACRPLAKGGGKLCVSPEIRVERHGTVKMIGKR